MINGQVCYADGRYLLIDSESFAYYIHLTDIEKFKLTEIKKGKTSQNLVGRGDPFHYVKTYCDKLNVNNTEYNIAGYIYPGHFELVKV